jgi:methylenetetrahydrofolate dehydrogenase (NADP+)/methenyltetrahydrofolate cyclohydrolase
MIARTIDGKAIAKARLQEIKAQIDAQSLKPALAVILGNDLEASAIYVEKKIQACAEVGITAHVHRIDPMADAHAFTGLIKTLNIDPNVHGVFVQLPLNNHLDSAHIVQCIAPHKDVDGLTHGNLGRVMANDKSGLVPCTPQGVMHILDAENISPSGKHAVIIGRSLLFGKPMGQLLLNANATVTYCHSKTVDIERITSQADILIAATGQANMVKANWVKDGAVVIDVGITRNADGHLTGDIDFDDVAPKASAITPVPGGVGPMTVACLLSNTVKACVSQSH